MYDLDKYDHKGGLEWAEEFPNPHQPYLANELLYVVARRGDTFKSLGKEFDISHRKLRKYNELPKDYVFRGGEIVYLEEKRRRATKDHVHMLFVAVIRCIAFHRSLVYDWSVCIR